MLIKTHFKYSNRLYEYIKDRTNLKVNKYLLKLGHLLPDFFLPKYFFRVHNFVYYKNEIQRSLDKIKLGKNVSINLGIVLHLIQDQFSKYHNHDMYNLYNHYKYEFDYHNWFKKELGIVSCGKSETNILKLVKDLHTDYLFYTDLRCPFELDYAYSYKACVGVINILSWGDSYENMQLFLRHTGHLR